jgi:Tfp pilus assembly protein PilN
MRPINLIPEEERRGPTAKLRSGPLAYILLGTLVAVLAGVTLLVTTSNQISEKNAEVTQLKGEVAVAEAEASKLASYTQFQEVHNQRVATVTNLAKSRFDWEKVMRQLALVLPDNVWLTSLMGSVRPDVGGGGGSGLRQSVAGPALELNGCAQGQEAVAGFVSVLKDIDGVTRVGVQSSDLGGESEETSGGGGRGESVSASGSCSGKSMAQFQMVVAFDAAPIPEATSGEGVEVAPEPAPEGEGESETTASTEGE